MSLNQFVIQFFVQQVVVTMGICKLKDKELIRYSTKAVLKSKTFNSIDFYFSTENLLRIDADSLIVFCDEKMNLKNNPFISRVGKFQRDKIKQFAEAHLLTTKVRLLPGQIVFFPINIATLRFSNIALICLQQWNGNDQLKEKIYLILKSLFDELEEKQTKSIAFTQFNEQFGIPINLSCRLIMNQLKQAKNWLKVVTFICNDSSSQQYYISRITNQKLDQMSRQMSEPSKASTYF